MEERKKRNKIRQKNEGEYKLQDNLNKGKLQLIILLGRVAWNSYLQKYILFPTWCVAQSFSGWSARAIGKEGFVVLFSMNKLVILE